MKSLKLKIERLVGNRITSEVNYRRD